MQKQSLRARKPLNQTLLGADRVMIKGNQIRHYWNALQRLLLTQFTWFNRCGKPIQLRVMI